jgi:hypothetical protein
VEGRLPLLRGQRSRAGESVGSMGKEASARCRAGLSVFVRTRRSSRPVETPAYQGSSGRGRRRSALGAHQAGRGRAGDRGDGRLAGSAAGSRLLDALVERAQEEGIRRFEAPVLAYNADAIHMLEGLGQTTWKHRGREVELTIDLPEAEAAAGVRPLLRQFAIGAVDRGRSLLERLWPRRRAARRTGAEPDRRRDRRLRARGRGRRGGGCAGGRMERDTGSGRRAAVPAARATGGHGGGVGGGRGAAGGAAWLCRRSCATGIRRSSSPTSPPRRTPG